MKAPKGKAAVGYGGIKASPNLRQKMVPVKTANVKNNGANPAGLVQKTPNRGKVVGGKPAKKVTK